MAPQEEVSDSVVAYYFGYAAAQPHPYMTSTGCEGCCELCGQGEEARIHRKPWNRVYSERYFELKLTQKGGKVMARQVNRKLDIEALAIVAEKVLEMGSVELQLKTKAAANRFRFQFYFWRKREQELNADPTFLADVSIHIDPDGVVTLTRNFQNMELRSAMKEAGLVLTQEESPDGTPVPENPYGL
jgi:hypothetical protein